MKPIVPALLGLLLIGSACLSGLVPAYADDQAPIAPPASSSSVAPQDSGRQDRAPGFNRNWRQRADEQGRGVGARPFANGGMRGSGAGGLGASLFRLGCGDRGAESLEIAFVRIQYEVKPTAEQQPLFDALKTAALADQKNYADACRAAISSVQGNKTTLDRFSARLALETARVNALNDVLPKFRTFFDSLTDQQKASFQPRRMNAMRNGGNMDRHGFEGWQRRQGGSERDRSQSPSAPQEPATPTLAPTETPA